MLKTRDGKNYEVGMWVYQDGNGIFEITEIASDFVYSKEVLADDEEGNYHLSEEEHRWTYQEAKLFKSMAA